MKLVLSSNGSEAIYKQIVAQVESSLRDGSLKPGEMLPSMNELALRLGISKETVKKAYKILTDKGIVTPRQGKGFFASDISVDVRPQVLVIFDKFSVYKEILFNAFADRLAGAAEITILNHNQSIDLLEYYLDSNLDRFDYYVVTPHFPLDEATQARAAKQLTRIPNRKLIMLDRLQPSFPGNYGAVYQDFENDIFDCLCGSVDAFGQDVALRVITLPSSLYGAHIRRGVERFASEKRISVEFLTAAPEDIRPGDTFLVLNSQLDAGLVALTRNIRKAGLQIGGQVRIISYNEFDMNELVLGGLTTVSTDFRQMGRTAAEMILDRSPRKVHNPFGMIRRNTF